MTMHQFVALCRTAAKAVFALDPGDGFDVRATLPGHYLMLQQHGEFTIDSDPLRAFVTLKFTAENVVSEEALALAIFDACKSKMNDTDFKVGREMLTYCYDCEHEPDCSEHAVAS